MSGEQILKKIILTITLLTAMVLPSAASQQTMLYDQVWKLINSKYVDETNNHQNWYKWRKNMTLILKQMKMHTLR